MQSPVFPTLFLFLVAVSCLVVPSAAAGALLLDATTFESTALGSGKAAFVKFFAPWCGHCKRLKPVWDDLADALAEREGVLIVDVDCTADGNKDLCARYDVQGFPTVKYFTGSTGAKGGDYKGARTLEALREFADTNLGPSCAPDNLDLCDDAQRVLMDAALALTPEELDASILAQEAAVAAAGAAFKDAVAGLQTQYEQLVATRTEAENALAPKLRLYRSVAAAAAAATEEEEEDHDEL
jgi:protein disulfide-isomerase-like protein